jgi:hypothetical protein
MKSGLIFEEVLEFTQSDRSKDAHREGQDLARSVADSPDFQFGTYREAPGLEAVRGCIQVHPPTDHLIRRQ